jgi:hypothetical protein
MFVGLFPKFPGEERNVPVFRFGRIALTTNEPVRGPDFGPMQGIILESHFNRGNSGAPLYQQLNTDHGILMFLIGVIAGGYADAGLVVAIPEQRLAEILHGAEARKQRSENPTKALKTQLTDPGRTA